MKYCPPEPPATAPGLIIHIEHPANLLGIPVDRQRKEIRNTPKRRLLRQRGRSHSALVHCFRSGEPNRRTFFSRASTVTMIQRRVGSCPEDLGIAEVAFIQVDHRIAGELAERPAVVAHRQILRLLVFKMTGIDGDQALLPLTEAA